LQLKILTICLHMRLLCAETEREAIEATNPVLVNNRTETFKALLRAVSSPR